MSELMQLVGEYLTRYPNEETPLNGMNAYGVDGLIKILKEAKGRRIVWEIDPERLDWQGYRFE